MLILLGALLPSVADSKLMITEMIARNALLQERCINFHDRRFLEYSRPGKQLLSKGGAVPELFGEDDRLNELGILRLAVALARKFISAKMVERAGRLVLQE